MTTPPRLSQIEERLAKINPERWKDDPCGFVAHAPTDLAYLLTRLKAAEAQVEKLLDYVSHKENCPRMAVAIGEVECNCGLDASFTTWQAHAMNARSLTLRRWRVLLHPAIRGKGVVLLVERKTRHGWECIGAWHFDE